MTDSSAKGTDLIDPSGDNRETRDALMPPTRKAGAEMRPVRIFDRLVRTPHPNRTESLLGYMLRVSAENGYRTPHFIWALAGIHTSKARFAGCPIDGLERIMGFEAAFLGGHTYRLRIDSRPASGRPKGKPFKILDHILGKGAVTQSTQLRLGTPALCPQCVLEAGYIDAFWDLSAAVACPVHECKVLSICPECKGPISWLRADLLQCSCGARLSDATTSRASRPLLVLMEIIRAKLWAGAEASRVELQPGNRCGMPVEQLLAIPLAVLLPVLNRLGMLLLAGRGAGPSRGKDEGKHKRKTWSSGSTLGQTFEVLSEAAKALSDWPVGFRRALRSCSPAFLGRSTENAPYRQDQDTFYCALFLHSRSVWTHLGFLQHEYFRYRSGKNVPEATGRLGQQHCVSESPNPARSFVKFLPGSHASESSSMDPGNRNGSIMSDRDIPRLVGFSLSILEVLRRRGVYETAPRVDRAFNWYSDDVDAFLDKLRSRRTRLSCVSEPQDRVVTVRKALRLVHRSSEAKADIIAAILDGRLVAKLGKGESLTEWLLDHDQLAEFLLPMRNTLDADTHTNRESARILKVDESAIPCAVKIGLLKEVRCENRVRISGESVRAFQLAYIPLSCIAKELQTSSRRLTRLCKMAQIKVLRLSRIKDRSKLSIISRNDEFRLTEKFEHEQRAKELRAFRQIEEPKTSRLSAYFERLELAGEKLPRRAGEPAKAIIARACGFGRDAFLRNNDLVKMLNTWDRKERAHSKEAGLNKEQRMRNYILSIKKRGLEIPRWSGKPNLTALASASGVSRDIFYECPKLLELIH